MKPFTLYALQQCSTCKDAKKWLTARGIPFTEKAIRETPPSVAELRTMLAAHGGERRRLFNSSGIEYRALGMAQKVPGMSEDEALRTLSGNGSLVKRPLVIGSGVALQGFDPERWAEAFKAL